MDFQLDEGQRILQKEIRRFLEKEIVPLVNEYEYERKPLTKEIIKKLVPFGFTRAIVPAEKGGLGDLVSYFIMIEELSRVWGSLRTLISVSSLAAYTIAMRGTKEQRERFLPGLFSLDILACFALTEPNVGSDASAVETTAERKGDHYLINGSKTMITGGSIADVVCLYATVDRAKKEKGITAFLVKKGESEFEASNIKKMGMHSSVLSELSFDDSRVPIENRLGEEGEGLRIALIGLNIGRVAVSFGAVGIAQAALDAAISHAKKRIQFGKPIGGFQLVQEMIVDMALKVDAARLLSLRAAELLSRGAECRREASFAKLFSTEMMMDVANKAIQVHGGYGYTEEYPVERYYRDGRHLTLAEGTSEIQKLIIGRDILGISAIT
jgi:alkylation response protein AidB-like acyl-CoA dehydrogenase